MLNRFRRRLGWKLFFSYLVVILVGMLVLAATLEAVVPGAFERHMVGMGPMMGGMMGGNPRGSDMFAGFRAAVNEAVMLAAWVAFIAAAVISLLVSRRVVAPVRQMMAASQRIAEGHYQERVEVPGDPAPEKADELTQLAIRFNRMAAQLEQTENMRRRLIGDVTHELRTPLTAIKGSMEGLIDGVLPAEAETYQQIYREADRLQRLVQDLQELSRVEAGAYPLNLAPKSLAELVEATVARLGRQFDEKGVALETEVPADLPPALADEDRIGQVLLNLVGNALQFTPAGGTVRIRAERRKDEVRVSVADSGIGIPLEHLPHVFTRFYRVDKSRARAGGGSGVGLTIAKHLVEAQGGRIWAESEGPGRGSTFTFTLPLAA